MRYVELLENSGDDKNILLFAEEIRKNCQPYLTENSDAVYRYPLFRGIHNMAPYLYKKVRLENRKPKDMDQAIHDFFNQKFTEYYGAPYRNAMFVSSSPAVAEEYGNVYLIFPKGKYTYIWNEDIDDLFSIVDEVIPKDLHRVMRNATSQQMKGILGPKTNLGIELDELAASYRTKNLMAAIDTHSEIMMRCEGYYAIQRDVLFYNIPLRKQFSQVLYNK